MDEKEKDALVRKTVDKAIGDAQNAVDKMLGKPTDHKPPETVK